MWKWKDGGRGSVLGVGIGSETGKWKDGGR